MAASPEPLASVSFEQFTNLDLRVATITSAEPHPGADRLLKIQLDDGTPDGRQVCAGIKAWYDPQNLVGTQVVIVANLEPRTIRGEVSQGMIMAASAMGDDGQKDEVRVLRIDAEMPPGSKVS
jgi:methionine--tRNA ligase beta chain